MRATSTEECLDYSPWLCEDCDTTECKSYKPPEALKVELEVKTDNQLKLFEL